MTPPTLPCSPERGLPMPQKFSVPIMSNGVQLHPVQHETLRRANLRFFEISSHSHASSFQKLSQDPQRSHGHHRAPKYTQNTPPSPKSTHKRQPNALCSKNKILVNLSSIVATERGTLPRTYRYRVPQNPQKHYSSSSRSGTLR